MAYEKLKKEEYRNIGGINQKASVYVTGETEVLDLVNYDFSTPGAWTKRWGMTGALAGNTLAVGASNRYNFGFQTYRTYYDVSGVSFTTGSYIQGNSQTYSLSLSNGVLASSSTLTANAGFGNVVNVAAGVTVSGFNYSNLAYFVSGKTTFKAGPEGVFYYGLPAYGGGNLLVTTFSYASIGATNSGSGTFSGTLSFMFCYEDLYGFVGAGAADVSYFYGVTLSSVFISGATFTSAALASGATYVRVYANNVSGYPTTEYVSVGRLSSGSTLSLGISSAGISRTAVLADQFETFTASERVPNAFYGTGVDTSLADSTINKNAFFNAGAADCVELYNNRLFWSLATGKNILFYSNPIEYLFDAQDIAPENFLNLSNTNFPLIGLKAYNQVLLALFQKGVTRITGDNPNNFTAFELSDEYGLVSSRAFVFFRDRFWFLDNNHIIEYNGANLNIVSHRVDSIIARVNLTAAQKTAVAYHYEERHEVWFAIPIDGSNENNIVLVYDYLADGWTTFKSSSNFTCLQPYYDQTLVQGVTGSTVYLNNKRVHAGHPGGSLGYFGASFASDYGNTITLSIKTRYHVEQGPSTTMLWRRLYLDTGPFAGVTLPFKVNFYANFATATPALSTTMIESGSPYSGEQQTRIDFGIPAKSLSAEIIYGLTAAVRVYGYTVESRFLRRV